MMCVTPALMSCAARIPLDVLCQVGQLRLNIRRLGCHSANATSMLYRPSDVAATRRAQRQLLLCLIRSSLQNWSTLVTNEAARQHPCQEALTSIIPKSLPTPSARNLVEPSIIFISAKGHDDGLLFPSIIYIIWCPEANQSNATCVVSQCLVWTGYWPLLNP